MSQEKHIPPVPEMAAVPHGGTGDLLKNLPLLLEVLHALESGTGTFSTATHWGKRWVRVQAEPFKD